MAYTDNGNNGHNSMYIFGKGMFTKVEICDKNTQHLKRNNFHRYDKPLKEIIIR